MTLFAPICTNPCLSRLRLFHSHLAQSPANGTPAVMDVQGDCQWPLKNEEIPTGHVSPQSTETGEILAYIYTSQSQKGDASQLEAMSRILPTVPIAPAYDCAAVQSNLYLVDLPGCQTTEDDTWPIDRSAANDAVSG